MRDSDNRAYPGSLCSPKIPVWGTLDMLVALSARALGKRIKAKKEDFYGL
jgi:hypothetical protein